MPMESFGCRMPTNAEMQTLQQDLMPRFINGRLAYNLLPFKESDFAQIIFHEPDIFRGMQNWRGLDKPTRTVRDHWNPYGSMRAVEPGYWGESDCISEAFLTRAAQPGTCMEVIDLTEHIVRRQERLLERRYNRIEFNIWQALIFGKYEALSDSGQVMEQQFFNVQQVSSIVPWSDPLLSTPMADFRCIKLRGRGTSASFGPTANAYMNAVTANCLFRNLNPVDIGKSALTACCTWQGLDVINQQFAAQELPKLHIYDEGFVDENGNFFPYLPDGYVAILGTRPGNVPLGHYWLTRNAVGCAISSGFWTKLVDTCDREVPRRISLYDGHNGGPAIEYPKAVIVLRTGCVNNCN